MPEESCTISATGRTDLLGFALTAREHQVSELVATGLHTKEVAMRLGISAGTVKIHLKHIFEKTGCHSRYELIALEAKANHGHSPSSKVPEE